MHFIKQRKINYPRVWQKALMTYHIASFGSYKFEQYPQVIPLHPRVVVEFKRVGRTETVTTRVVAGTPIKGNNTRE